ncbi:hypothetical protein [Archaeoglobus sulfaticallidus]|nr:hypothetical protein [Archaeoglobus sulfaticallidus]
MRSIKEKIEWAKRTYQRTCQEKEILDESISEMLKELEKKIARSSEVMKKNGVSRMCAECGDMSCCGEGIEERFDPVTILINYMLGVEVQEERVKKGWCIFLTERGCSLKAREIICINYLCDKIKEMLSLDELREVQLVCGEEMDLLFKLSEEIKKRLRRQ